VHFQGFATHLSEGLFRSKPSSVKVIARWRGNLQDHLDGGHCPSLVLVSHGAGKTLRHCLATAACLGAAAAEVCRAARRADGAEEVLEAATLFQQGGELTDAAVLSRAALLLRDDFAGAMRGKKEARLLATSAGASLGHTEASVGGVAPRFLFQLCTGIHHSELDGNVPPPPAWHKAVLSAADLFFSTTGQHTPKQVAVATVLRANKTKGRVVDMLANLDMCAQSRHARELENAVAADPAFGPAAFIDRLLALYGDDLMIRVVCDNCDHPIAGAMGLDVQCSHVNIELTLYRKSGLPIRKLAAPMENVSAAVNGAFLFLACCVEFRLLNLEHRPRSIADGPPDSRPSPSIRSCRRAACDAETPAKNGGRPGLGPGGCRRNFTAVPSREQPVSGLVWELGW